MKASLKLKFRYVLGWLQLHSGFYSKIHRGKLLILMYHRVLPANEIQNQWIQPGMYVREDIFARQMLFLRRRFSIVPFAELLRRWKTRDRLDQGRYCVITFDDGWLDNYLHAYPLLKKLGIPATVFLPTSFIGTDQWFWTDKAAYLAGKLNGSSLSFLPREYDWIKKIMQNPERTENPSHRGEKIHRIIEGLKTRPEKEGMKFMESLPPKLGIEFPNRRLVMNWKEVTEMSDNGISFGSHSCTHRRLPDLSSEELQKELEDSWKAICDKKVNGIPVFCYPGGAYNPATLEQVKHAGYRAAVTTRFGLVDCRESDPFQLRRIGIHNDISCTIPLFSWRISGIENRSA